MLYDAKRWDRKLYLGHARQALFDAADYLHEHGWCQYALTDREGRVCVLGAIKSVAEYEDGLLAARLLQGYLGAVSVGIWNDTICRNKAQAIEALIGAAND